MRHYYDISCDLIEMCMQIGMKHIIKLDWKTTDCDKRKKRHIEKKAFKL